MTPNFLLITFVGLTFGMGVVALVLALRGHTSAEVRPPRALQLHRWSRATKVRWAIAIGGGLVTLLITRWITVAAAVALIAVLWPRLFGGAHSQTLQIRKLEALTNWVESLRDTISTGQALPEALPFSVRSAGPEIAEPLANLLDRMYARESLDQALLQLADDLDDPEADSVIGALAMNARVQGKRLNVVLTSLAESSRKQLTIRREVEAGRASMRRGVSFVIITTVAVVVGMSIFNRSYVEPYSTVTGQIVLGIVIALFTGGLYWLRRLADFETRHRFLATPQTARANLAPEPVAVDLTSADFEFSTSTVSSHIPAPTASAQSAGPASSTAPVRASEETR